MTTVVIFADTGTDPYISLSTALYGDGRFFRRHRYDNRPLCHYLSGFLDPMFLSNGFLSYEVSVKATLM